MTEPFEPTPPTPAAAPPAAPPAPVSERFVQVFTAPARAMAAVAARPAWLVPALVIAILMLLYTAVNMHIFMPEQTEAQLEHATGPQAEALEKQLELYSDPPIWLRIVMGLGAGLGVVLFAILVPAWVLHLFLRLSSGQGAARQTIGVVCWAAIIPYVLRTVLSWVILVGTGSGRSAGLTAASLLPDANPQSVSYTIASLYGDPFMYWMLWVVVLGVSQVHRLPVSRSVIVVAATFALLSVFPIGFTLLGQLFSQG
ncbi:MAG TPA: YIP1 family protein [Candidatus Krumholzibacteria bacterium]|nr:YIP1 family protein [Candidatus Krumholzibacteria bacterium]HPD70906.1 YIP1 family protein [Candidatus Krumholzibacteria bacterium]HRY39394.1 YIP1 family protein [Candidatus Krumholzibacteria bacterium]